MTDRSDLQGLTGLLLAYFQCSHDGIERKDHLLRVDGFLGEDEREKESEEP